ncbi:MAG: SRPBCC family protein [Coraliomargaritaceae bacterium]
MPKIHTLYREQTIATDLDTAWDFISRPENLNEITPDDMHFQIVSDVPERMRDGLIIEYRIGIPLLGKQVWLSELKHIREKHSFVDEQRIGPYRLWYHYHEITETAEGIRFVDRVHYALPCGPFGGIAHQLYVKGQLRHIFDYRKVAMERIFTK